MTTQELELLVENFKKKNSGKNFSINLTEKSRVYHNGMYYHLIRVYWDKFYDRLCGNGWMWGQDAFLCFDDNGLVISSENYKNDSYLPSDFISFNYSGKTISEALNNIKI